jgi:hypothetical protein
MADGGGALLDTTLDDKRATVEGITVRIVAATKSP